jgi:hypothetical protein
MVEMDPLHLWHLVLLSLWAGIVVAETVVEQVGRRHVAAAAHMHYWIDLLLELPVIGGILVTGTVLAVRAWPLTPLHWLKIGAGLIAVGSNLFCAVAVVRRRHAEEAAMKAYQMQIHLSILGTPFAIVAAYIGFHYFTP